MIGFVFVFAGAYKRKMSHTLDSRRKLDLVEEKLANTNQSSNVLSSLQGEVKRLDDIIGGNNLKPELVQPNILDFITGQDMETNVVSIEDVHLHSDSEFKIYSNQIVVEGAFNDLVTLLYNIEKQYKESRIVSTKLYSKKNYQTNTTKLYLKIILQNYEKNK